jgi:predicted DNA-binding transcriptional regulator AlpA
VRIHNERDRILSEGSMTARALADIRPVPRRGLSRVESGIYVGVSATLFDEMVKDGRMPMPKRINGRVVWDIRALDEAFEALPDEDGRKGSNCEPSPWEVT